MTTQTDDHTLNACLARVANKDVQEVPCGAYPGADVCWQFINDNGENERWIPLHDANQMELVEAWLRENDIHIVYVWDGENHHWDLMPQVKFSKIYRAYDPDKKRAFALAVWEMENRNNEKIKRKERAKV